MLWLFSLATVVQILWIVTSVDTGTCDPFRAHCVVATFEWVNSGWVMVEDGSALDAQVVELSRVLH